LPEPPAPGKAHAHLGGQRDSSTQTARYRRTDRWRKCGRCGCGRIRRTGGQQRDCLRLLFKPRHRQASDFSPGFFRAELERLGSWAEDQQWFAVKDYPALREPVVLASNRQSIEYIVAQCRAELRANPSTQVKSVVLPEGSAPPGSGSGE
jgi:hypothetical protein